MVYLVRIIIALFLCGAVHAKMPDMVFVVEAFAIKPQEKFVIERRYIGTIKAEKFSLLGAKSSGTVASIHIKPGQHVKEGQLLVSLSSTIETKSVAIAEKSLQLAEEKLARSRSLYKSRDITKSQLGEAESEVLIAKTKLESQKQLKENVEIRAPFSGTVGLPRVVLGESVQAQAPIISLVDGAYSVFINIPASRLSEVKIGQNVRFKNSKSTVAAVEHTIDPTTRTGFAKVVMPNCESCIVGDSVYAHISVHEKNNVILINKNAFYYKNQKPQVVVIAKDEGEKRRAEIREIVVGEEQDGLIEVLSGLKEGEEIVGANPKRVPDKAALTVIR